MKNNFKLGFVGIFLVLTLIIIIPYTSSMTKIETPYDNFNNWKILKHDGNESILYDLNLENNELCLTPKFEGSKIIKEDFYDEKLNKTIQLNKEYTQPDTLRVRTLQETRYISKIDAEFCYNLNYTKSIWYKFGEMSIIIEGDTSYNSIDNNITQETGFAHLSLNDSSIVLYMPFDANVSSSTTYDYSENNNDGTVTGATFNSSGKYGGAYEFDGDGDYIEVVDLGYEEFNNKNFTWSIWVKGVMVSDFAFMPIIGYGSSSTNRVGFRPIIDGDATSWSFFVRNATSGLQSASCGDTSIDSWINLVVVGDSEGSMSCYYNGVFVDSIDYIKGISVASGFGLGHSISSGWSEYLNGSIDEVSIYNRSLTADEINDTFNNQSSRFFNEGTMLFNNTNVSESGNENRLNITLDKYQNLLSTNISVALNNGTYFNLSSDGTITNLEFTDDPNYLNITFKFMSDSNNFYTPLIIGNITLDSWVVPPVLEESTLRFDWGTWMNDSLRPEKICFLMRSSEFCMNQTFSTGQLWKSVSGIVQLINPSDVSINGSLGIGVDPTHQFHILLNQTDNFFIDGRTNPREITLGAVRQEHTAGIDSTRAYHIDVKPTGFDDTRGMNIRMDLKNSNKNIRVKNINLDADITGATNVHWNAIEVSHVGDIGEGVSIDALDVRGNVNVIDHHTGEFNTANYNFIENNSIFINSTNAFGSINENLTIFENDNDYIYLGNDINFTAIEVNLETVASNPGTKSVFEYSLGGGSWGTLSITDNTNGFRESGIISMTLPEDWTNNTVESISTKWIRIQRTSNSLGTIPVEFQIRVATEIVYEWDGNGDVNIRNLLLAQNLNYSNNPFMIQGPESSIRLYPTPNMTDDMRVFEVLNGNENALFRINQGGDGLGSSTSRSFMIGSTNSSCISMTPLVDCNTSTTGADFIIQDELAVLGSAYLSNGTVNTTDEGDLNVLGNISLGDKITFKFGEVIDNVLGWLKITGSLNVTENLTVSGDVNIGGDVNISGNSHVEGNFTGNQIYASAIFHNDSLVTIDLTTSGVYVPLPLWNESEQDANNVLLLNGFEFIDNATLRAQADGIYNIYWQISYQSQPNAEHAGTILVNNVSQHIHAHRTIGTANEIGSMSAMGAVILSAGDNVSVGLQDEAGAVSDPDIMAAQFVITRIGN